VGLVTGPDGLVHEGPVTSRTSAGPVTVIDNVSEGCITPLVNLGSP